MEKPILFSTAMVQAILEGRKTQTRRTKGLERADMTNVCGVNIVPGGIFCDRSGNEIKCPYGKVGDLLWVRESCTWVMNHHAHDLLEGAKDNNQWVYKASTHDDFMRYAKKKYGYKWKPSIHMPKSACRIWLEIVSIRVERLKDISEVDAINEGVSTEKPGHDLLPIRFMNYKRGVHQGLGFGAINSFQTLWESINGEESWNDNPWVWVVEFKRIDK